MIAARRRQAQIELSKGSHEEILKGYVHETARRAIAENALAFVAEQRKVVVAFAKIDGLEPALMAGAAGLAVLQQCLEVALTCIQVCPLSFRPHPLSSPSPFVPSPFVPSPFVSWCIQFCV